MLGRRHCHHHCGGAHAQGLQRPTRDAQAQPGCGALGGRAGHGVGLRRHLPGCLEPRRRDELLHVEALGSATRARHWLRHAAGLGATMPRALRHVRPGLQQRRGLCSRRARRFGDCLVEQRNHWWQARGRRAARQCLAHAWRYPRRAAQAHGEGRMGHLQPQGKHLLRYCVKHGFHCQVDSL